MCINIKENYTFMSGVFDRYRPIYKRHQSLLEAKAYSLTRCQEVEASCHFIAFFEFKKESNLLCG